MKKRIGNPLEHSRRFLGLQSIRGHAPTTATTPATRSFLKNRATYFKSACLALLLSFMGMAQAQNVAINADGSKPNPNAILDIKSANKGLLIPRMTTQARTNIPNTQGLLVYDVNTNSFWYNTGKQWQDMSGASLAAATLADSAWLLTGNAGTVDNVNFIGTTDNVPFNVRVNDQRSGRIDPTMDNTLWGYRAGSQITTGKNNTAVGSGALLTTSTGIDNTAVGSGAMLNNTGGFSNSAFGRLALQNNTSGAYNTAIGQAALTNNSTGSENVAVGVGASFGGSGSKNTSVGTNSQFFSNGSENTAVGAYCQTYSLNVGNTAVGCMASTAIPSATGLNNAYNTAIGHSAATNDGSNSTALGHGATTKGNNSTAIGAGANAEVANKVRIGNSAVTVIEGQVPFTTPSDGRFKFAVQEDVKGLEFIMQLRPVTYQFDVRRFDAEQGNATNSNMYDEAARMRRTGFIAQEVEQAAVTSGFDFSGIIKPKSANEHYSLSYDAFVVPLVKAMQEQQQIIDKQRVQIEAQQKQNAEQDKQLADMQAQLNELRQLLKSRSK